MSEMNDHDLLITLHEQVKQIRGDIKDLKDNTTTRVTSLEARVSDLEAWKWKALGALAVLTIAADFVIKRFIK